MTRPTLACRRAWLLCDLFFIAGCSHSVRAPGPIGSKTSYWQGRLSIRSAGPSELSFFAGFELRGAAEAGELQLLTPLGSTLARVTWTLNSATLHRGDEVRSYASLDDLLRQLLGTPLPIAALIDWLRGTDTAATGWSVDLSGWTARQSVMVRSCRVSMKMKSFRG